MDVKIPYILHYCSLGTTKLINIPSKHKEPFLSHDVVTSVVNITPYKGKAIPVQERKVPGG
jgi:hypothetical protein